MKSYVFDTNGPRERDFHEETIAIDTGEADFRPTVTHFMISFDLFMIFAFFCSKLLVFVRDRDFDGENIIGF